MTTYTPQARQDEIAGAAFRDGAINGLYALVPSGLGLWAAMKNPTFVKGTNWQSRTALVVMPALFVFGYTGERRLERDMKHMANEGASTAEKAWTKNRQRIQKGVGAADADAEREIMDVYRREAENSGVRIVPGNQLGLHHRVANYWQENPFKMLAAMGVPTVLYIFNGKSHQQHLQLQSKIMHTRVYGQFAVIGMLLTLMGFKTYMDTNGRYVTESEQEAKFEELAESREILLSKIELSKRAADARHEMVRKAHDLDVESHRLKG